jgi:nucleoside phosphorylase
MDDRLITPDISSLKSPDYLISLWNYVGTFNADNLPDFRSLHFTAYGPLGSALSAFAIIHGPETELFRRMATRAGSLNFVSELVIAEVTTALPRQFDFPNALGKPLFVTNSNPLAVWINFVLFCVGKFQSKRLDPLTLPVDPFAASLAACDHVLDLMHQSDAEPERSARNPSPNAGMTVTTSTPRVHTGPPPPPVTTNSDDTPLVDFLIFATLEEERDAVLSKLPNPRMLERDGTDVHTYFESYLPTARQDKAIYRILVTSPASLGPIHAAITASAAAMRWEPLHVIVVGIAGGLSQEVTLGDLIVAKAVSDYTVGKFHQDGRREERWESFPSDASLLNAANAFRTGWEDLVTEARPDDGTPTRHVGVVASGGNIIASKEVIAAYREDWPKLLGVEMERGRCRSGAASSPDTTSFPDDPQCIRPCRRGRQRCHQETLARICTRRSCILHNWISAARPCLRVWNSGEMRGAERTLTTAHEARSYRASTRGARQSFR